MLKLKHTILAIALGHCTFAHSTEVSSCSSALIVEDLHAQIEKITSHAKIKSALEKLSTVYRSGWQRRGIPDSLGETVLAHSKKVYHAALIYPFGEHKLDRKRMALMGYFHDIAEHVVPDYTPHDNITREQKHTLERQAIVELIAGADADGQLILSLWEEYEEQKTLESKIIFQLDKLDASIQAFEYQKLGYEVSEFFSYTQSKLSDPLLKDILRDLQTMPATTKAYDYYFSRLLR